MTPRTLLELGRVSNLPTVWSNVLAGAALSGATPRIVPVALAGLAGSLFYVGGMFLNDAFDAEIDRKERPERPIPSGRARRGSVFALGFLQLAVGVTLLGIGAAVGSSPAEDAWPLAGAATAALVVLYDRFHKGVAWSPVVMGLCRAGLYVLGALAVTPRLSLLVLAGAAALLLYVVGLTYVARYETSSFVGRFWPTLFLFSPLALALALVLAPTGPSSTVAAGFLVLLCALLNLVWTFRALLLVRRGGKSIGSAVGALIVGIAFVDALLASAAHHSLVATAALAAGVATLVAHRKIRGT